MVLDEDGDQSPVPELARTASLQLPPEIASSVETSDLTEGKSSDSSDVSVMTSEAPQEGISQRRLAIIVFGLCLTIFLTAMDQVHGLCGDFNFRPSFRRRYPRLSMTWVILRVILGLGLRISSQGRSS